MNGLIDHTVYMEKMNVPESLPALGWIFTGVLLVVAIVCWAAGAGKIPLNGAVGLRIPPLTRNAAAWKAGHAAGVVPAVVAFAVGLVCCLVGLFAPTLYWGAIAALIGGLVWVVIAAVRASHAAEI